MQNREFIVFERIRDTEHWESTSRACICESRAHYPPRIPSSTNRRVDSCTTYEYNCRICPLEVFVFRLKDNKKFQRTGKIFACWYSSNDSYNQKHITLKGITLFQCWGFLENQSNFTSWYGITARLSRYCYEDFVSRCKRSPTKSNYSFTKWNSTKIEIQNGQNWLIPDQIRSTNHLTGLA